MSPKMSTPLDSQSKRQAKIADKTTTMNRSGIYTTQLSLETGCNRRFNSLMTRMIATDVKLMAAVKP
jgi:hypothetical protein